MLLIHFLVIQAHAHRRRKSPFFMLRRKLSSLLSTPISAYPIPLTSICFLSLSSSSPSSIYKSFKIASAPLTMENAPKETLLSFKIASISPSLILRSANGEKADCLSNESAMESASDELIPTGMAAIA